MKPKLTQGPPVKGNDFFNRKDIIADAWDSLEKSSVLLVGPRRFGKTSIMFHLKNKPRKGFSTLFFDVEHIESPEEFIVELIEELQKHKEMWKKIGPGLISFFKKIGEQVEEIEIQKIRVKLRESRSVKWKDLGKQLIILLEKNEKNLLLIFDEFPEMIKSMIERDRKNSSDETKVFLSWLRKIRLTISTKFRFVIGGSISLDNILNQIHSSAKVNDLVRIKVGPFSNENAQRLIRELFASEKQKITDDNKI